MKTRTIPWLVAIACMIMSASFYVRPTLATQLLYMLSQLILLIYLPVTIWQAVSRWKLNGLYGVIAPGLFLCVLPVAVVSGYNIRDLVFAYDLKRYDEAAQWAAAAAVRGQEIELKVPARYADLTLRLIVRHDSECGVAVDFLWAGAFPLKHWIRRHSTVNLLTPNSPCTKDWPWVHQRSEHWYELTD